MLPNARCSARMIPTTVCRPSCPPTAHTRRKLKGYLYRPASTWVLAMRPFWSKTGHDRTSGAFLLERGPRLWVRPFRYAAAHSPPGRGLSCPPPWWAFCFGLAKAGIGHLLHGSASTGPGMSHTPCNNNILQDGKLHCNDDKGQSAKRP